MLSIESIISKILLSKASETSEKVYGFDRSVLRSDVMAEQPKISKSSNRFCLLDTKLLLTEF